MRRSIIVSLSVLIVMVGMVAMVSAQEKTLLKMIRGGVLNGKAISLPKPEYPEEAKKDGAEGPVSVAVTIDEEGNVIEAKAQAEFKKAGASDGEGMITVPVHPALQEAAEKAAWGAKFSPTKLNSQPIKVSGTIVYNFVGPSSADDKTVPRPVNGGVLNGKAVMLPKPVYPEAALKARVMGAVSVQITIDEAGNVISARGISGHPFLRAAAVEAAKQAQFSPTLLSGQPVKVSGVLTYNFIPPTVDSKEN